MNSPLSPENKAVLRKIGVQKDVFFRRLLVTDPTVQKDMVDAISAELEEMLMIDEPEDDLLVDYYPTLVRLAQEAPFPVVRTAFTELMEKVEDKFPQLSELRNAAPELSASYFIDNNDLVKAETNDDEELLTLYCEEFIRTGRVSHLVQVLGWHKSYLSLFQLSMSSIMVRDGSLPQHWRNYIAVMAAAELRCYYLADLEQHHFILNGGDETWLKGIDYISPKLFQLHELSSLLAHRPWLITADHIAELLASDQDDSWSVSELVHAIIVMCKFHSMSCIALGVGCAEERDLVVFGEYSDPETSSQRKSSHVQLPADNASSCGSISDQDLSMIERDDNLLLQRLKSNSQDDSDTADDEDEVDDENDDEGNGVDILEEEEDEFVVAENEADMDMHATTGYRRKDTLWRFCGGSVIRYADFDIRSDEYNVLHTEDFSWDEHCFSLVKRYFPGKAGQILEDLFNLTSKLTYDYYGTQHEESVDTSPYRNAVWYYVHRIFGICHDDYDYRQVNVYLNRPTKMFIKKVACTPWKVRKEDFEHFDRTLSPSEKCHVTLIVAEARKQAGLLYGLRAVMEHMR